MVSVTVRKALGGFDGKLVMIYCVLWIGTGLGWGGSSDYRFEQLSRLLNPFSDLNRNSMIQNDVRSISKVRELQALSDPNIPRPIPLPRSERELEVRIPRIERPYPFPTLPFLDGDFQVVKRRRNGSEHGLIFFRDRPAAVRG